MRGVGRGISVLDGGSTSYKGKGRFWGVLFQIFTIGFFIRSPTEKCFRFVCENLIRYPFGKYITGELNSLAFRGYIQIRYLSCGLREIIKNVTVIMRQHYGTLHRSRSYRRHSDDSCAACALILRYFGLVVINTGRRRSARYSVSGLFTPVDFSRRCPLLTSMYCEKTAEAIHADAVLCGGSSWAKESCIRWACTSVPSGECGGTILRGGYEWICHHGWRRGLFPNYFGQSSHYSYYTRV